MLKHLLICLFFWSGVAQANTVLIFGDSLSAGFGLEPKQAWASIIAQRWQEKETSPFLGKTLVSVEKRLKEVSPDFLHPWRLMTPS